MHENSIGRVVVDCAYKVHKNLGPGLLESTYQACLAYELKKRGLQIEAETALPVYYDEVKINCGYRIDLWVQRKVIIELKTVTVLERIHMAQVLTYLKLTDNRLGFLINFNVIRIKHGIRRVVNKL
jgi:GxxExxY protein